MNELLLDERILADGSLARTYASISESDKLRVRDEHESLDGELSITAVDRVMTRYGLPLEDTVRLEGDALDLGAGRRLRRFRHHAPVDATGRDYLVWERPDEAPLAVIATHATAALRYLVLRIGAELSAEHSRKTEG